MCALYSVSTLSSSSLKQQSARRHVTPLDQNNMIWCKSAVMLRPLQW